MDEEKEAEKIVEEEKKEPIKMNEELEGKPATTNKYDRQIRLWGSHGQKMLMEVKILLVGGDLPGVETLKNLVLPGVGSIHIMDHKFVTKRDVGCNFFTPHETQGQRRAKVLVQYLSEMNSDVKTFEAIIKDPVDITNEDFKPFSFVIINQQPEQIVQKAAQICESLKLKYIIQRNYGFFGYLRLFSPNHTIIEGKIQNVELIDLRLNDPIQGLIDYEEKIDMDSLPETEHSHVAYPIILLKELKKWKAEHEGNIPKNFSEKQEFMKQIKAESRKYMVKKYLEKSIKAWEKDNDELTEEKRKELEENSEMQNPITEQNFEEAMKNAGKLLYKDPNENKLESIFKEADKQDAQTCNFFWLLVKALKIFWEQNKKFPLLGTIPDMRSLTEDYQALQKIYQDEAQVDRVAFDKILEEVKGEREKQISEERIKLFLKNSQILNYVNYRSYADEVASPNALPKYPETDCHKLLLAIKGMIEYQNVNEKMPNLDNTGDSAELLGFINCTIALKYPNSKAIDKKLAEELSRYEGCQLNPIASLMGGIASQEVIKMITHQYLPINNTLIFNGITSEMEVFEM